MDEDDDDQSEFSSSPYELRDFDLLSSVEEGGDEDYNEENSDGEEDEENDREEFGTVDITHFNDDTSSATTITPSISTTTTSPQQAPGPLSRIGLNTDKAGMDSVDVQHVNKVIYEMSKGSRFFKKSEKDDARVNSRVEKVCHHTTYTGNSCTDVE